MSYSIKCFELISDNLHLLLLRKGAHAVLVECLRGYIADKFVDLDCVECGCRALKGLLINS